MRTIACMVVGALLLVSVYGCGGECSVIAAATTLGVELRIGDLSACQWQALYSDGPGIAAALGIDELNNLNLPPLSDEQAQAIVNFLDANGITVASELGAKMDSGELTFEDLPDSLQQFYLEFLSANS